MSSIAADIRTLTPGARIELFKLDASAQGGEALYWHPHTTSGVIEFGDWTCSPFPVEATGFEKSTSGALPRPRLRASNIDGALGIILRLTGDLVGAVLTRRVTFAQYLNGAPGADPAQRLPDEVWIVERKISETKDVIELELRAAVDVETAKLPGRPMIANSCVWRYRGGDGCPYAGPPLTRADGTPFAGTLSDEGEWSDGTAYAANDYVWFLDPEGVRVYYVASITTAAGIPLSDRAHWQPDVCRKTLPACKLRFGSTAALPYGGFPGCERLPRV